MSYLALYRKFRPRGFDKLVGQDAIVRTLKNQILTDKVGHAYLFCGARGTGKTSAAKIFAKAINCLSPVDGSPCGTCAVCRALATTNIDVVEMDAASNNKVEEIRELRENVQYPPVSCRYKVYIVDEVHMLTESAFNALLKTLEEPPAHAVFLLATTEPQKLPATILSRCMRFDFKLIETPVIAKLISDVYDEEGKAYEEEAVMAIAKAGNGSVRDALSVADVCLSYGEGKLTYRDVTEVLGAADKDKTLEFLSNVLSGKDGEALTIADELTKSGKNAFLIAKDAVAMLRDLTVVKKCARPEEILNYPQSEVDALKQTAAPVDEKRLLRTLELFADAEGRMRYAASPKVLLETATIKAALPETDFNLAALLFRVNALTEEVKNLKKELDSRPAVAQVSAPAPVTATAEGQAEKPAPVTATTEVQAEKPAPKVEIKAQPKVEMKEQPKVEAVTPSPAIENQRAYSVEEFGAPPPEADYLPPEAYIPPVAKAEPPKVEPKPQAPVGSLPKGRLFGALLRALRSNGHVFLWTVCTELKNRETDTELFLYADEAAYPILVREEHASTLKKVLATLSDKTLVLGKGEPQADSFDEDVQKLKNAFGADFVTIK